LKEIASKLQQVQKLAGHFVHDYADQDSLLPWTWATDFYSDQIVVRKFTSAFQGNAMNK